MDNYNYWRNERDMLDGNINRMFLSKSQDEIINMYDWAKRRLDDMFKYNVNRPDTIDDIK